MADDDTDPLDQLPPPPASGIPMDTDDQNAQAGGAPPATDSQTSGGNEPYALQQTPQDEQASQPSPGGIQAGNPSGDIGGQQYGSGGQQPTQGQLMRGGDPATQAKMMQDYIAGDGSQEGQAALKQSMDQVRQQKGNEGIDDSAAFIKAVDGQNDPRDATKLMRAGRYLFNQNINLARVFHDKGQDDKSAIAANHAFAYNPNGYHANFTPAGDNVVVNVKKLGSADQPTVLTMPKQSYGDWIHGDAKNYNSHMEGDTLQSLQQAAQNAKGQAPGPQGEAVADKEGSFEPRGSAAGPPATAQGPSPQQLTGETPPKPQTPGEAQQQADQESQFGPNAPGAARDKYGVQRAGPDYNAQQDQTDRQAKYERAAQGGGQAPGGDIVGQNGTAITPAGQNILKGQPGGQPAGQQADLNVTRFGVKTPYNKATGQAVGPSTGVPASVARGRGGARVLTPAAAKPAKPPNPNVGAGKTTQEAAAQRQATHDKTVFENSSQLQKQKAFLAGDDRLERKQDGTVDFKEAAKPQTGNQTQQNAGVQQEAQTNPQEIAKTKQLPFVGTEPDIKRLGLKSGAAFIGPDGRQGTVP